MSPRSWDERLAGRLQDVLEGCTIQQTLFLRPQVRTELLGTSPSEGGCGDPSAGRTVRHRRKNCSADGLTRFSSIIYKRCMKTGGIRPLLFDRGGKALVIAVVAIFLVCASLFCSPVHHPADHAKSFPAVPSVCVSEATSLLSSIGGQSSGELAGSYHLLLFGLAAALWTGIESRRHIRGAAMNSLRGGFLQVSSRRLRLYCAYLN